MCNVVWEKEAPTIVPQVEAKQQNAGAAAGGGAGASGGSAGSAAAAAAAKVDPKRQVSAPHPIFGAVKPAVATTSISAGGASKPAAAATTVAAKK